MTNNIIENGNQAISIQEEEERNMNRIKNLLHDDWKFIYWDRATYIKDEICTRTGLVYKNDALTLLECFDKRKYSSRRGEFYHGILTVTDRNGKVKPKRRREVIRAPWSKNGSSGHDREWVSVIENGDYVVLLERQGGRLEDSVNTTNILIGEVVTMKEVITVSGDYRYNKKVLSPVIQTVTKLEISGKEPINPEYWINRVPDELHKTVKRLLKTMRWWFEK